MKKTVVLGVTSGIAAYKSLELIKLLKQKKINVLVIMTKHATQMVDPADFEKVSGHKIFVDLFEKEFNYRRVLQTRKVDHIELADKADLMIIVPATANILAKIAHGIADDFLTTTLLAVTAPVLICPSMNVNMWNNPIVRKNVDKLKAFGYRIIEPASGMLACGYEGKGRLEEITFIRDAILDEIYRSESLAGKRIIVTAGGTSEKIDEVRSITNRSSGKMGIAIAEACYLRGADVLLLRAKIAIASRYLIKEQIFTTTDDLYMLVIKEVKNCDIFYHVAAVSDFRISEPFPGKISSSSPASLRLKPQIKILDQIKKLNPDITLIAFKAEHGLEEKDLIDVSYKRLKKSGADAIIANDVSRSDRGFETNTNEVLIVLPNKIVKKIPFATKKKVAEDIVDYLSQRLSPTKN